MYLSKWLVLLWRNLSQDEQVGYRFDSVESVVNSSIFLIPVFSQILWVVCFRQSLTVSQAGVQWRELVSTSRVQMILLPQPPE